GVQDEIERGRAQDPIHPAQRVREDPRQGLELELLALLEVRGVPLGEHPHLERKPRGKGRDGDRKSTRLNSSHGRSSYAVFCLKKKSRASSGCAVALASQPARHLSLVSGPIQQTTPRYWFPKPYSDLTARVRAPSGFTHLVSSR